MRVDALEFAGKDSTSVDVVGVGLDRFVVAQDLRGTGSWHRCEEQGVAHSVFGEFRFQRRPVPEIGWLDVPQVVLEELGRWD